MIDFLSLGPALFKLARQGVRIFLRTLALAILGGVVVGGICSWFLRDEPAYIRALSWVLVLIECLVVGFLVASRRAVSNTMAEGLTSLRLGSSLVGLLFDQPATQKQEDAQLAPGLQKLEPGEAVRLLQDSGETLRQESSRSGWLPKSWQNRLLDLVQEHALVQVREKGGEAKQVDLQGVRTELKETIDQRLADQVRSSARQWTLLALIGLPLLAAVQTYLLFQLAQRS